MNRCKALYWTLKKTPWFIENSWYYIVNYRWKSKVEFFVGIVPAWFCFMKLTYKDCRGNYHGS